MEAVTPRRNQGLLWALLGLAVATGLALYIRLPDLDMRLLHADESVHAMRYQEVLQGTYRYDPNEFHGPTLYYAALPIMALRGKHDFGTIGVADYRLVTVLFGVLLVWMAPLAIEGLPAGAAVLAGLFIALSPVLGYYSRYYIQEMLLAVFTIAFLGALFRAAARRDGRWLVAAGALAGLMVATKETATLSFIAAGLALALARLPRPERDHRLAGRQIGAAVGLFALTMFALLSGFGHAPSAPFEFVKSLVTWGQRAAGPAFHGQPPYYYLELFLYHRLRRGFYSEGALLLFALVGAGLLWRRSAWARFVALYTLLLTIGYSVIPYKTPWCVVQIVAPLCLLAGAGGWLLLSSGPWWRRLPCGALVVAAAAQLGLQSQNVNHKLSTSQHNPYSHSLTTPDIEELAELVEKVASTQPTGAQTMVVVANIDGYYWPLPWYLRRLPHVGYFDHLPSDAELGGKLSLAPIVLTATKFTDQARPRLETTHEDVGVKSIRSQIFLRVWVEKSAWERFLAKHGGPADSEP